ncbi:MAG: hypothetical protein AB7R89_21570 [Dehalococcoidia bacterium]
MASDGFRRITRTNPKTGKTYTYFEVRFAVDGTPKSFSAPTKREAREKRDQFLRLREQSVAVERKGHKQTLGKYLAFWSEEYGRSNRPRPPSITRD